ncbi:hypothetical protein ACIA59_28570 [Micromonospora haikouensis]|uniref:hypothetical protein n=1 Tax=Micromonospora haikouensis TaxID=686309 RepID=UPI003797FA16
MTYGQQLDRAAAAIAAAQVSLRHPRPGGIADHAAAAIARTHLYRAIERQVKRLSARRSDAVLIRELQHATHTTTLEMPLAPTTDHPVPTALRQAAEAARVASDILYAQFDPTDGRPRTPEGFAIQTGVLHAGSLPRLAQLARAAGEVDHGLAAWLHQGVAAGSHQLIVRTAASDARTTSLMLPHTVDAIASERPLHSLLRDLQPPPLTDTARRWASITSPTDCVRALDVARTWLVQHHQHLTANDLKVLLRTGLALTYEIDYLIQAAHPGTHRTPTAGILASLWRGAAQASMHLHTLGNPESGVGPTVLAAAERWLRDQLRPNGDWREPKTLLRSRGGRAWQSAGTALAARLPDLASLVHQGALLAVRRGDMREPDPLQRRPPDRAVRPRWIRASPASPQGAALLRFTGQLREETVALACEAGSKVLPGLHEAERRKLRQARPDRMTAPGVTASTGHPSSPQPSNPRSRLANRAGVETTRYSHWSTIKELPRSWPSGAEQALTERNIHGEGPDEGPSL